MVDTSRAKPARAKTIKFASPAAASTSVDAWGTGVNRGPQPVHLLIAPYLKRELER